MTGLDEHAAGRLLRGVANPVLAKPFDGAELIGAIESVLSNLRHGRAES